MSLPKIDLPKPDSNKIFKQLDKLGLSYKDIERWEGTDFYAALYYTYLFSAYNLSCPVNVPFEMGGVDLARNFSLIIYLGNKNKQVVEQYVENVSKHLAKCIDDLDDNGILTIPMNINDDKNMGHANLLIYRKKNNTFEHFEPHGSYIHHNKNVIIKISQYILKIITSVGNKISKKMNKQLEYVPSNQVCPRINGLQMIEAQIKKDAKEGRGYCAIWSMFFAELILKNPTYTSNELLDIILNDNRVNAKYLTDLARGYTLRVYNKTYEILKILTDNDIEAINDLKKLSLIFRSDKKKYAKYKLLLHDIRNFVGIQNLIISGQTTIDVLISEFENKKSDSDRQTLKLLHKMKQIEYKITPETISFDPVKISSLKKISTPLTQTKFSSLKKTSSPLTQTKISSLKRNSSLKKTSSPLTQTKISSLKRNSSIKKTSSPLTKTKKSLKPCKEGQERNPETNRCRNIKKQTKKTSCKKTARQTKKTELKPCKPGQIRNPATNRCKKM
jgi:hypothetical protein